MLLALDSATHQAGICLYDGEMVRAEALWRSSRVYHTEWLTPAIAQALERIDASVADIEAVAVTTGPGSFTGLRVALSVAKGIAAARDLPIIGVPSLLVTAAPHMSGERSVVALLSAGRGRHAWQQWDGPPAGEAWQTSRAPSVNTIQQIAARLAEANDAPPPLVVGELTAAEHAFLEGALGGQVRLLSPARAVRRPAILAELAWQRWQAGDADDLHHLEPLYLRMAPSNDRDSG